jgi:glutamyl-tRNA reductase
VIETCHRVEAYAGTDEEADRLHAVARPSGSELLEGASLVRHAIALAVGRDSVVLGEDQILHQVRETVDSARRLGTLDPGLERLFAAALHAGRRARSWHPGPQRSLATVAVDEIERRVGPIRGGGLLVVGAGRMGRLAARAGAARGAEILVANRTLDAAAAVAAEVHGRAVPFDPGPNDAGRAGIVIALSGPWAIGQATLAVVADGPIVVDLSVPGALPAELVAALGDRLVTAEAIARDDATAERDPATALHLARLDRLIDQATAEFLIWLDDRDRRTTAAALARRVDQARELELDALWRRIPQADAETRAAIDGMARHLGQRLLREPLEHLRDDPDGSAERAIREVFAL